MISAKPAAVVAVLALAGVSIAQEQEKADEQRIAELLEQLDDPEGRDVAFHRIVAMGRPAVRVIRARIEEGEYTVEHFAMLGDIGPEAADTFPVLMDLVPDCPAEDRPALFRALFTLWGFLPQKRLVWRQLIEAPYPFLAEGKSNEVRKRLESEWQRGSAITGPPEIDPSGSVEVLTKVFAERHRGAPTNNRKEFAAWLLGMRGAEAKPALPQLVGMLRLPVVREVGTVVLPDIRLDYENGPESNKRYAEAILRIDPTGLEALEAHSYMIEHGDSYQQRESVRGLLESVRSRLESERGRQALGESGDSVTMLLVRIAANPDQEAAFRYEALTSLGMIGPPAGVAIPTLETLTEHADAQIAQRATAAMRGIGDVPQRVRRQETELSPPPKPREDPPTAPIPDPRRARASEPPDEQRLTELIEQASDGNLVAADTLTNLGESAAPLLVAKILELASSGEDDAWRRLGHVLNHMGPGARSALPMLVEELRESKKVDPGRDGARTDGRRALALVLLTMVGPWHPDIEDLVRGVAPASPDTVTPEEFAQWSRLLSKARIGPDDPLEDVIPFIVSDDTVQRIFAIQILGHRGPDASRTVELRSEHGAYPWSAMQALSQALRSPHPPDTRGDTPRELVGVVDYWAAWAMKEIAPRSSITIPALVYFLQIAKGNANTTLGREAAILLGEMGPRKYLLTVGAVDALVEAASMGGGQPPLVAYEAITALGMIGPAAKDAIPVLEKLTGHDDAQIVERAKAALRQIRDG